MSVKVLLFGFFLLNFFPFEIHSQTTQEISALELNKPIEREIKGTQKHTYQITLSEGQFAKVDVEQRGIDVVLRLIGTDEKNITRIDYEIWTKGTEKLEVVAKVAGVYKIEVSASYVVLPAGRYEIRFTELRAANENDSLLQEARIAYSESTNLRRTGKLREAFAQIQRALEIREKVLGKDHPEVATTLDTVAFFYFSMGDYVKCESLLQRALEIKEKKLEPNHPDIAQTLNSFGLVLNDKGDYAKAETFLQRALQIREKSLGTNHPGVANTLNSLASLYIDTADYIKAEPLFLRSLEINEKVFGKESEDVAVALNNLALLNSQKGDYDRAEEFYKRALEINEKVLKPDHPSIARSLNNLATVYQKKNEFAKAEPLLLRALALREKSLSADSPDVAQTLYNLGTVYHATDVFDKAEKMYKRSLAILEARLGTEHINLTYPLKALAGLYRNKGEYDRAEEILLRVLNIREKVVGQFHPDVASDLESISLVYAAKGMAEKSIAALSRAAAISERVLALNLATGSEKQKLAYLDKLSDTTDQIISLQTFTFPDNKKARELAITTLLQRKGRVQDAMVDTLGKLKERLSEQDRALLDKLNETNSQLAKLVLNGPEGMPLEEHQANIKTLEEQKENLESEVSRRNTEYLSQIKPIILASVKDSIQDYTALVEFVVYRRFDPKATSKKKELGESHYAAYIINKQGEVKWKELGEAKAIDEAVENFRQALRDPKRKDVQALARVVGEKIMQPIKNLFGDVKHILISPDGALNLIPFEALVDEQGKFLVESYSLSYLTSGRDLLRMQTARESKSKPLVIANPFFGEPESLLATNTRKTNSSRKQRKSITAARSMSDTYFAPLGGTAQEARSIQTLFPESVFLTEAQATESALKQTNAPQILHIATHGFFLEDGKASENINAKIENPLLRSGLALAGANQRKDGKDDGVLTALEATGLNLWGTKLVVLSACDTGLGEVKNGEGVYGLRRAFVLAGTETLVMSLWSVSDYVTRELMTNYYKNLKQGFGRGEALRQVQLSMLKRRERQHPFYWASFIQSGEWANLDGKR